MYSTVGASWYIVPQFGGDFGVKCGGSVAEVCGNGCGMSEKRSEGCSEDGGEMVAFCSLQKFSRTVAGEFLV